MSAAPAPAQDSGGIDSVSGNLWAGPEVLQRWARRGCSYLPLNRISTFYSEEPRCLVLPPENSSLSCTVKLFLNQMDFIFFLESKFCSLRTHTSTTKMRNKQSASLILDRGVIVVIGFDAPWWSFWLCNSVLPSQCSHDDAIVVVFVVVAGSFQSKSACWAR